MHASINICGMLTACLALCLSAVGTQGQTVCLKKLSPKGGVGYHFEDSCLLFLLNIENNGNTSISFSLRFIDYTTCQLPS